MRHAFTQSRMMDFFTRKELAMQIGQDPDAWGRALLKEVVDNALDACEAAGIAPNIDITISDGKIAVADNGPGIPAHIIDGVLDFSVRISTNSAYVSPSRGQLGNALKCVVAAPFVLNGAVGVVDIEAKCQRHRIEIRMDHIRQEPVISHTIHESDVSVGTKWTLHSPELARLLDLEEPGDLFWGEWMRLGFESVNPHARITLNGQQAYRYADTQKKWTTKKPTSPHWYSLERFQNLVASYVREQGNTTVRDFSSQFLGLTRSDIRSRLLERTGMAAKSMADLVVDGRVDPSQTATLLDAMKVLTDEVEPSRLGAVGRDAVLNWMESFDIIEESFKYKRLSFGTNHGLPYVIEVAFATLADDECRRTITCGVNFTPMLGVPVRELFDYLSDCRVDSSDQCLIWLHIITPAPVFTDAGKSILCLPGGHDLQEAVQSVTGFWTKAKRKADRDNRLHAAAVRKALDAERKKPMSQKEAAYAVMVQAYLKASDDNTLPANARQVMYAARGDILRLAEIESFKDSYFTQTLLPDFINEHPELTDDWDVVYDDRGHMIEPHTRRSVALGTLKVRGYIQSWSDAAVSSGTPEIDDVIAITSGPSGRYQFALFIEKEGFHHLLSAARIAERYDIAIMSSKGMSNTSTRRLVESLTEQGVTILVAHDFDKSGLDILDKLRTDTRRYAYKTPPRIIDIGLRLEDVLEMELESETTLMTSGKSPAILLREQGATEAEINFLVSGGKPKQWTGQRVELNAMTSRQFIDWLERKLEQCGVRKVLPDAEMLNQAFNRAVFLEQVRQAVATMTLVERDMPSDLMDRVTEIMDESPELPWEAAVQQVFDETCNA